MIPPTRTAAGPVAMMLGCALAACASSPATPPPVAPEARCERGDTTLVRDLIYFGRNRPGGGTVSDAEWQGFLDSVVAPRFPAGFTVVEAEGHWRGASGLVERERTEVMTLLHPGDESSRRAVAELAGEYIRRFRQEAVLRERVIECARFQTE